MHMLIFFEYNVCRGNVKIDNLICYFIQEAAVRMKLENVQYVALRVYTNKLVYGRFL